MCAAYPPPIQNLSIYNPQNYSSNNDNLTIRQANQSYLRLTGGTVSGNLTANNGLKIASGGTNLQNVQFGQYQRLIATNIPASNSFTTTITFPTAYSISGFPPRVFVANTSTAGALTALNFLYCSVNSNTYTGFTLVITNVHPSATFNDFITVDWLAFRQD